MAQDRLGTALDVLTQCRQNAVRRVASFVVPNVPESVGMQARTLCDDSQSPVLELFADEFK